MALFVENSFSSGKFSVPPLSNKKKYPHSWKEYGIGVILEDQRRSNTLRITRAPCALKYNCISLQYKTLYNYLSTEQDKTFHSFQQTIPCYIPRTLQ